MFLMISFLLQVEVDVGEIWFCCVGIGVIDGLQIRKSFVDLFVRFFLKFGLLVLGCFGNSFGLIVVVVSDWLVGDFVMMCVVWNVGIRLVIVEIEIVCCRVFDWLFVGLFCEGQDCGLF